MLADKPYNIVVMHTYACMPMLLRLVIFPITPTAPLVDLLWEEILEPHLEFYSRKVS